MEIGNGWKRSRLWRYSGVYRLRHKATGMQYVGAGRSIGMRLNAHLGQLRGGKHFNRAMQADWTRDGETAFIFEVLVDCYDHELRAQEAETTLLIPIGLRYNQRVGGGPWSETPNAHEQWAVQRYRHAGIHRPWVPLPT